MPKSNKPSIDGILNIDKPYGITSMDVVRRIKRASRQRRVGHAGTLDPIATGVIPVCIGQATRMMEDLINGGKAYRGQVELGVSTATYDALGEVTVRADATGIERADVAAAAARFAGEILQVPPMYSALKRNGKRLYDLARAGVEVEREARQVVAHEVVLEDWTPPIATIRVSCGRGFYMRSLAHDLGQALGCGGSLRALTRLRCGAFGIEDAVSLEEAEDRFATGDWRAITHAPDVALQSLPALVVGKQSEDLLRNGRAIEGGMAAQQDARARAYSADGRFLASVKYDAGLRMWKPERVFSLAYSDGE